MSARLKCWHTCLSTITGLPSHSSSYRTAAFPGSKGVTLSSSLIRAHAPAQLSSAYFSLGLVWRIFAGYCQFLLRVGPSRRYLCETLLGCLDLCHGGIWGALARYFPHIVGLPQRVMGRLPTKFHPMTSWWALFSRLQPFLNVQTSKLACHPGHPYGNGVPVGQPWRLHPGRACVVTSTCTGHAIRPKRAIDGRGLSPHKSHSLVGYSYPYQRSSDLVLGSSFQPAFFTVSSRSDWDFLLGRRLIATPERRAYQRVYNAGA